MAKRAVPAGYVRTPKGGIAPAIGGQIVGIRANTASLDNLAYGLSELRGEISVRLMNSAMRESVPGAVKTARDLTVSDGGYDKAGKGAEVRRGIRGGMKGQGQAFVSSVNNWYSLRHWGDNQDPTADYRRHGLRGVRVTGHYAARNYFAPGAKEAFVRIGNNGNILLFGRTGPGRTPLHSYSAINSAHVLHHYRVYDQVVNKFNERLEIRFLSKYNGALNRIKAKYGL
jgi:hypothetical protein